MIVVTLLVALAYGWKWALLTFCVLAVARAWAQEIVRRERAR